MTQKDKELLLRDLCARVPYGVKCKLIYNNQAIKDEDATLFGIDKYGSFLFAEFGEDTRKFVCKPYLFPMSNMTKEQRKEYEWIIYRNIELHCERYYNVIDIDEFDCLMDFYHKYHFDYRGLIEKGLAINATNLNIY